MKKVIINCDDCGYSDKINANIRTAIEKGKITSTTIMANMTDLEGAISLYNDYKESISFGIHLNLTEGEPLTGNKLLTDLGLFGRGLSTEGLRYKRFNKRERKAIYDELKFQIETLLSHEVKISHIDSHHTALFVLPIVCKLAKEYNITKMRRKTNYDPFSLKTILKKGYYLYLKLLYPKVITTDGMCSYQQYYDNPSLFTKGNIELMTHLGGHYPQEEKFLWETDIEKKFDVKLINWNKL